MSNLFAGRETLAHDRPVPSRILAAARLLALSFADAVAAARAYRELDCLSDRELAARGLTRATLARHVSDTYLGA